MNQHADPLAPVERTWEGLVFAWLSVDGFIARADHDIAWLEDLPAAPHAPAQAHPQIPDFDDVLATCDHMVMGRATYQKVRSMGFWPYEPLQVIVLSSTLPEDRADGVLVVDASGAEPVITPGTASGAQIQLGGFWILEAADKSEALELGAQASAACHQPVEVRQMQG